MHQHQELSSTNPPRPCHTCNNTCYHCYQLQTSQQHHSKGSPPANFMLSAIFALIDIFDEYFYSIANFEYLLRTFNTSPGHFRDMKTVRLLHLRSMNAPKSVTFLTVPSTASSNFNSWKAVLPAFFFFLATDKLFAVTNNSSLFVGLNSVNTNVNLLILDTWINLSHTYLIQGLQG